jgi:hypothetical protein
MERSSVNHSLSGLSGVAAGIVALLSYVIVYGIVDPLMENNPGFVQTVAGRSYLVNIYFIASLLCLITALSSVLYFTRRNSIKRGTPFFDPAMKKMFLNLAIPLFAGGVFCFMLFVEQQYLLIAPCMLVFYGLALIHASHNTIIQIRYLGLLQLMLGLIAIFLKEYGLWFWIAGFGLVNVLCGAYIYFTYERAS